ncbi:hypothetical protein QVD17_37094 [Tagetes erecta]|uniref:Uncharacterized protein n=1 Tax=Tagetes erecta TaxID=13708 RepID=A0AAD8JTX6_TARER|nr:hypothetical protein QVD17_37094 [Tagetes erecta]
MDSGASFHATHSNEALQNLKEGELQRAFRLTDEKATATSGKEDYKRLLSLRSPFLRRRHHHLPFSDCYSSTIVHLLASSSSLSLIQGSNGFNIFGECDLKIEDDRADNHEVKSIIRHIVESMKNRANHGLC